MSTTARTFWEEQGGSYARTWEPPARRAMAARELDFVGRHARPTARSVLDIGIGTGRLLAHHVRASTAPEIFGADIALEMVSQCRARFVDEPRIAGLVVADVADGLPFARQFDVISAIRVLKYSPAWRRSIAVIADLLTLGGVTVFSMPNRNSINRLSRSYGAPWHSTTVRELESVCTRNGLDVLEIAGFTRLPYSLYDRTTSRGAETLVTGAESVSEKVLGPRLLARELFVAAKRR